MRVFLCNSPPSPPPPPPPPPSTTINRPQKPHLSLPHKPSFLHSLTGAALSFNLLIFSPISPLPPQSIASDLNSSGIQLECREEDQRREEEENRFQNAPELVTNQEIVKEAWEIVNDGYLGSDPNRWSPETWLQKKEDIMGTSLQTRSKAHDVIRRMLSSLGDPYTRFLSPPEFSKMARYDISGIGVNLREVPDENGEVKLKVLGLILDGPAHTAGVRQGDELLSVDGVDLKGKSAFEALSILQGPSDTSVNIMVKHGNCGPVQSMDVQRQLVAKTPVFYRLEKIDSSNISVGYVRLKEFNARARKDVITAMKRLQEMGASYFVLDLRDNLGGLVQEGIEIAKLFLSEGQTVIYTAGRDPQNVKSIVAERDPLITVPVIVLVNNNTASASEIVASALHDNCRAILVGERTYGKGLIQSVFELLDGSGVVVTVGKYVTPNHLDINGNGIDPDYKKLPAWNEVVERLSKCQTQHG
ncbi:carboxyl-terminal-processing peptidase 1, chloroplastic isoform X1 [Rutidosis leptorrhynchoides]|uniref:carboxyl-terminal-processing peptidase 1, chloroplastic isoform X1 n=1 Tax=Rutidosis leptorrhynchoides TaxID=125765 RepID=UPI003A9A50B1